MRARAAAAGVGAAVALVGGAGAASAAFTASTALSGGAATAAVAALLQPAGGGQPSTSHSQSTVLAVSALVPVVPAPTAALELTSASTVPVTVTLVLGAGGVLGTGDVVQSCTAPWSGTTCPGASAVVVRLPDTPVSTRALAPGDPPVHLLMTNGTSVLHTATLAVTASPPPGRDRTDG